MSESEAIFFLSLFLPLSSAARLFLGCLVRGLGDDDCLALAGQVSLCCVVVGLERFLTNNLINLGEDVLERLFYVCGIQGGGFDEGEGLVLAETLRVLSLHASEVAEVTLVPDKHDHYVRIRMVPKLLQPAAHVLKSTWCPRKK